MYPIFVLFISPVKIEIFQVCLFHIIGNFVFHPIFFFPEYLLNYECTVRSWMNRGKLCLYQGIIENCYDIIVMSSYWGVPLWGVRGAGQTPVEFCFWHIIILFHQCNDKKHYTSAILLSFTFYSLYLVNILVFMCFSLLLKSDTFSGINLSSPAVFDLDGETNIML